MLRALLVTGAILTCGCSVVLPYDSRPTDATAAGDSGAADHRAPDADAGVTGDSAPGWPVIDGGPSTCATLQTTDPVLPVSTGGSAAAPAIASVGDRFFVAYEQDSAAYVRSVDLTVNQASQQPALKLSASGPARTPAVAYSAAASRLGVVWAEPTSPPACATRLMFAELGDTLTPPPNGACDLGHKLPAYGYLRPRIVARSTAFTISASVDLNCSGHRKALIHSVGHGQTCDAAALPSPYTSGLNYLSAVHQAVVQESADGGLYFVVRQRTTLDSTTPTEVLVDLHTTTAFAAWSWCGQLADVGAWPGALTAAGFPGGAWLAWPVWTTTAHDNQRVALHRSTGTGAGTRLPMEDELGREVWATDPALAYSAAGDVGALVYVPLNEAGERAGTLEARTLQPGEATVPNTALSVVRQPASPDTQPWAPRQPVVAAGNHGFGVAWVDDRSGSPQVYFRYLACAAH